MGAATTGNFNLPSKLLGIGMDYTFTLKLMFNLLKAKE
tara:strand:- start:4643 stop:4756 length:114 start_codon:yes stop_codon:yes gene_type:complete